MGCKGRRDPFVAHLFAHFQQPLSPGPFPHSGIGAGIKSKADIDEMLRAGNGL